MEKKQITLRLPIDLYEKIKKEAERKGIGINAEISKFIRENY
ncbi:Arc family DNA-binding protein [Staphylococcus xylosus]